MRVWKWVENDYSVEDKESFKLVLHHENQPKHMCEETD